MRNDVRLAVLPRFGDWWHPRDIPSVTATFAGRAAAHYAVEDDQLNDAVRVPQETDIRDFIGTSASHSSFRVAAFRVAPSRSKAAAPQAASLRALIIFTRTRTGAGTQAPDVAPASFDWQPECLMSLQR